MSVSTSSSLASSTSSSLSSVKIHPTSLDATSPEGKGNSQTSVQNVALESLTSLTDSLSIGVEHPEDKEIILKALGGDKQTHVERFEKEHGHTMQAIMDAIVKELAEMRKAGAEQRFGGFKVAGKKKWKFLLELKEGKINEISIGCKLAVGGFTKVYSTLDGKVIKVPRKDVKDSMEQMKSSDHIVGKLHDKYIEIGSFSAEFQKILDKLEFPVNDFQTCIQKLRKVLPPLPMRIPIGDSEQCIMIEPKATPVRMLFYYPPKDLQEIMQRLMILENIALCLTLAHGLGLIHGDIKPDNMLLSSEGYGQLADFGGSLFLTPEVNPDIAANLISTMTMTPNHVNYKDRCLKHALLSDEATPTVAYSNLGRALDVYALGISLVEALNGLYNSKNERQSACVNYTKENNRHYVDGDSDTRREVACLRNISPKGHEALQMLLDTALNSDYEERLDAADFVQVLHLIINHLKSLLQQDAT